MRGKISDNLLGCDAIAESGFDALTRDHAYDEVWESRLERYEEVEDSDLEWIGRVCVYAVVCFEDDVALLLRGHGTAVRRAVDFAYERRGIAG